MGCRSERESPPDKQHSREKTTETNDEMIEDESVLVRCYEQATQLISMQLDMCNHALNQTTATPVEKQPDSLHSFSNMLIESLSRLHSAVSTLSQTLSSTQAELRSLKTSNTLLRTIIKAREADLETLGEDYYAYAIQRIPGNDLKRKISALPSPQGYLPFGQVLEQFPETPHEEDEEEDMTFALARKSTFLEHIQKSQNLEKFLLALHLDAERQYETQQAVLKYWSNLTQSAQLVQGMAQSKLDNVTLEGSFKAKLLKSNPIINYLASGALSLDDRMPAYELFPLLFQTLDSAFELGDIEKSFPELVLEYLSITLPIKSKIHQFLGTLFLSLQTFYAEGDSYAVFFARILRVFHPDPLLNGVTQALLSINATISTMTSKKKQVLSVRMTDEMTGGNVYLASVLECAFHLPLSTDVKLFEHFLTTIKPAEFDDLDWAAFVIASKAEYLMIDLASVSALELRDHLHYLKHILNLEAIFIFLPSESLSPDVISQLFNPRVYAEIKDLLFLPRGLALDAFLQVYDLYVESLVAMLTSIAPSGVVARSQLEEFLLLLAPTIKDEERGLVWENALKLTGNDGISPSRDGVYLAIITSDTLSIAIKPLLMKEGAETQQKHAREMSFDYSHGRLSANFRTDEKLGAARRSIGPKVFRDLSRRISIL